MKKGISLIVLVITIIIIIILAGAVILNLNNNNPIDNANKSVLMQEESDFRSGAALWMFQLIADSRQNPYIEVKSGDSWVSINSDAAAVKENNTGALYLSPATYVGIDEKAIPAGYYDLDSVKVTPWRLNSGVDANNNATGTEGTLELDTGKTVSGYAEIINAVGMTPSKAGKNNQYKIAMNKFGNTIFYTDKTTLNTYNNRNGSNN